MDTSGRRRKRRRRRISKRAMQLGIAAVILILFCIFIFSPNDYNDFLDALGMRESSDNYEVVNRFGYMGRYQLGGPALQDAGFQDAYGQWTELAASYGIASGEDFLASPKGQDAAVRLYHTKLCSYIRSYGLEQYLDTEYCGVKVTKSGLLAACHLVGIRNMSKALASGEVVCDGNQTPASEYLELFSGYDISKVWNP